MRAIGVLQLLEGPIRPRFPTPPEATKRAVGIVVGFLTILVLANPIPLSNIAAAFVIAVISLAYLEQDALLLAVALSAAVILIAIDAAVVSEPICVQREKNEPAE